jgi:hypothetical protein
MKSLLIAALLFSTGAVAGNLPDDDTIFKTFASKVLQLDGIQDGKVVEILQPKTPFAFSYCRKGSDTLWRHEFVISNLKDEENTTKKVVPDRAIELSSKACTIEA